MKGDLIRGVGQSNKVTILEPDCGHRLSSDLLLYHEEVTGLLSPLWKFPQAIMLSLAKLSFITLYMN